VPGLLLAFLMGTYIVVQATRRPELAPRTGEHVAWGDRFRSLGRILPAVALILVVLGTMYTGLATPTESAAVGALGAFAIGGLVYRALSWDSLRRILVATTQVSCAMLAIVAAALVFTKVLVNARVPESLTGFVAGLDLPAYVVMLAIMVALLALGCLVDAASLLLVVTPVLVPVVTELGFSPLWFGVLLVMNLEMAVITPPVGLNLYAMKSVVPEVPLTDIIRGIWPFVVLEFVFLMVMMAVPGISTWLPSTVG
jgi:C4-dicarboxylate transporter, DctM subunit